MKNLWGTKTSTCTGSACGSKCTTWGSKCTTCTGSTWGSKCVPPPPCGTKFGAGKTGCHSIHDDIEEEQSLLFQGKARKVFYCGKYRDTYVLFYDWQDGLCLMDRSVYIGADGPRYRFNLQTSYKLHLSGNKLTFAKGAKVLALKPKGNRYFTRFDNATVVSELAENDGKMQYKVKFDGEIEEYNVNQEFVIPTEQYWQNEAAAYKKKDSDDSDSSDEKHKKKHNKKCKDDSDESDSSDEKHKKKHSKKCKDDSDESDSSDEKHKKKHSKKHHKHHKHSRKNEQQPKVIIMPIYLPYGYNYSYYPY